MDSWSYEVGGRFAVPGCAPVARIHGPGLSGIAVYRSLAHYTERTVESGGIINPRATRTLMEHKHMLLAAISSTREISGKADLADLRHSTLLLTKR